MIYSPVSLIELVLLIHLIFVYLAEGINVFAVNPGWVWTSSRLTLIEAFGFYPFLILYPLLQFLKLAFGRKPKTGARTIIYCAVEPVLEQSPYLYFEYVYQLKS
jgi:hypothetical protein